ncbi:hypothetical protein SLA2020_220100 [Shorea laevis]
MSTLSAPRRRQEFQSGGKMVRARRTTVTRTPYDRPRLASSVDQNPNWISRLIYSPTRLIATGAGKLLSSVFGSESSESSSSASSSGSSAPSDDIYNNGNDIYDSSPGAKHIKKRELQMAQTIAQMSESKRLIEQLLMRETFSREECERLTNIIKSRIVNSSMIGVMDGERLNETPSRTTDNVVDTAVMEAKKWFEEKKSGSSSKSDLCHKTSALNYAILPLGSEGEVGSPVDMAKSYMQTRPSWASPSVNHIEHRSPSPIEIHIFKEGTPHSIAENSLSSSKLKWDSPTTSSWNIQEELRKVRSKATEDMLRARPSSKIDWSPFTSEHKNSHALIFADRLGSAQGHELPVSTKSEDASLNLAAGRVSEMTQELLLSDALPNHTTLNCEQNEGMEAFQGIKRTGGEMLDVGQRLKSPEDIKTGTHSDVGAANVDQLETNETGQQLNSTISKTIQDSRTPDKNCSTSEPALEIGGSGFTANGSHSSGFREQDYRPRDEEANIGGSEHDKNVTAPVEETCEFLSEASVEVPNVNENGSIATGSPNSSSMHYEDSSQNLNRTNSKRRKKNNGVETLLGMKLSRSNKRGRGRGRGRGR